MTEPTDPSQPPPRRRPSLDVPPSVLSVLSEKIGEAPRVSLREEPSLVSGAPVIDPASKERAALPEGRGSYTVLGEIARGGMGVVLRGHDTDLGRDVAMKVLHKDYADRPDVVQRFVEEAQIGGQLQHPGIVPVYELGLMADERPYFTMKLVKGRTLATLLAEREDVASDRRRLLDVFESMCQTVAYAHSRGVIHRDLKPANVMVGAFGEVQVVDWGLAKVLARGGVEDERRAKQVQTELTVLETVRSDGSGSGTDSLVGSVLGTPSYMPPEQASGRVDRLDERADVFALGAILCEILTGAPPYAPDTGTTVQQAAAADLDGALERLDSCGADEGLVKIARQCLMAAPAARPRNAGVLDESVQAWAEGQDERARRAQIDAAEARVRATQERKARRLTLALAATVVASLVLGGGAYLRGERARAEQEAEAAERRASLRAEVEEALAEANLAAEREDWDAARAALGRARALAETGDEAALGASVLTAGRLLAAEEDAALRRAERAADTARLLEELQAANDPIELDPMLDPAVRRAAQFARFPDLFAAHGIDVDGSAPEALASQLAERGLGSEVATLLDAWGASRRANGDEAGALHLLETAHALDPDPLRADLREAVSNGDVDQLRTLAAGDLAPHSSETLELLGESLMRLGELEQARRLLERALPGHADSARLHSLAAEALAPGGLVLSGRQERRLARRALQHRRAAAALQPESAGAHFELGRLHLRLGEFAQALPILERARQLDEDRAMIKLVQAFALVGVREYERALELQRELEADDDDAPTMRTFFQTDLKADVLWLMGEHRAAIEARELAVSLRGYDIGQIIDLWSRRVALGDLDLALSDFEANAPKNPEGYNNCAWALSIGTFFEGIDAEYSRRVGRHAVRLAELGIGPGVRDANQLNTLGFAHLASGDYEAAEADVQRAFEFQGHEGGLHNHLLLVLALAGQGRLDEARAWFERARPWIDGTIDWLPEPELQMIAVRAAGAAGVEYEPPAWWWPL